MEQKTIKSITRNTVKDVDSEKGIVKFAFAAYNKSDSDGDIIEPGAYKKSYKERGPKASNQIKHFKWHDNRYVPGKLLEIYDEGGYGIAVSKIAGTTLGKDTMIEYQEGLITEHSHGFNQLNPKNQDENGLNHIKEGFLWEVSSLTGWGAQSDTPTLDIKEIKSESQLLTTLDAINKYLTVGEFSDELLNHFEQKYKQLELLYRQLKSPDGTPSGPPDGTNEHWKYLINHLKVG